MRNQEADNLWGKLSDVPIDDDECIDIDFLDFPKGTHREDIWHWFEEKYNLSVTELMGLEERG